MATDHRTAQRSREFYDRWEMNSHLSVRKFRKATKAMPEQTYHNPLERKLKHWPQEPPSGVQLADIAVFGALLGNLRERHRRWAHDFNPRYALSYQRPAKLLTAVIEND